MLLLQLALRVGFYMRRRRAYAHKSICKTDNASLLQGVAQWAAGDAMATLKVLSSSPLPQCPCLVNVPPGPGAYLDARMLLSEYHRIRHERQ